MTISAEAQEVLEFYKTNGPKAVFRDPMSYTAFLKKREEEERKPYQLPAFVSEYVEVTPSITPTTKITYYVLKPRGGAPTSDLKILYIHGGGLIYEIGQGQWNFAIRLVQRFGCTVYVPIYPCVPLYTYEQTYAGLLDLYRLLCDQRMWKSFVLAGDSSGGMLCEALSCFAAQQELPQPAAILYYFAAFDIRTDDPAMIELAKTDPVIDLINDPIDLWAPHADLTVFPPNPFFGSLAQHPPFLALASANDMLLPQARAFKAKADALGIRYHYHEYEGMFHDFIQWTIPETDDALERTAVFLQERGIVG